MAAEKEPAKALLPYLQRADELQKHEPLVAYYCRLYAMERGLKIPQSDRTKTTNALLVSLMKQLEKDKKSLVLEPDDHLHLEGFASNVFAKADKQDRAGRADLSTAKTFYAASIFLDILNQFGQLEPDLEQKQKYAVWKAADIRKALNEGRKPIPGPPGGENDSYVLPSASSSGEHQGAEFDGNGSSAQPGNTSVHPARSNVSTPDVSPDLHLRDDFQQHTNSPESLNPPQSSSFGISPQSQYSSTAPEPSNVPQSSVYPISPQPPYPTDSAYQPYYPQQYQPPPQPPFHQDYGSSSPDPHSYVYPNFQSYPSFAESSLPAAPTHHPSHYQPSDASPPSNTTVYHSSSPYNSGKVNGSAPDAPPPPSSRKFEYDSSYQPPPDRIAEAHKAARFAVGALAFDDVSVAVDHLIKSLELLTNPSAKH